MDKADADAWLDSLSDADLMDDSAIGLRIDETIGRYTSEALAVPVANRLHRLRGGHGTLMIGLVEALARDELWDALADSVAADPEIAPDLAFLALETLEGTGRIEARPALLELRVELDDLLEEGLDISTLALQIEDDPDSLPLALEALSRIEPDIRDSILAELVDAEPTPGILALREGLAWRPPSDPGRGLALANLIPSIVRSVIGPVDSEGFGEVGFVVQRSGGHHLAGFVCDLRSGLVKSQVFADLGREDAIERLQETASRFGEDSTRDDHESALALVSGSTWFGRESDRFQHKPTLDLVFGDGFEPLPVFTELDEGWPAKGLEISTAEDALEVFSQRPGWIDRSELTERLALEMALRDRIGSPDPAADPGPFRVLLEGRILGRIELYRRMLLWEAIAWRRSRPESAAIARRLALELGDPQNAVPGHPFLEELMRRSLGDAMRRLDRREPQGPLSEPGS